MKLLMFRTQMTFSVTIVERKILLKQIIKKGLRFTSIAVKHHIT